VICHLVKANPDLPARKAPAGKHLCDFQIVIMTKGWARFMYEDKDSCLRRRRHPSTTGHHPLSVRLLEGHGCLEIVSPADFKTVDVPPGADKVPPVTPWK
jgi:hypothetical protein